MSSKKRKQSNTDHYSDSPPKPTTDHRTEEDFNGSATSESANDVTLLKNTDDIKLMLQSDVDDRFTEICRHFEIRSKMAKYLPELYKFEIVCICDDSGSMNTPVDGTDRTRWDELCSIVKDIVKISVIFDTNGIDIHFLNRKPLLSVTDPTLIDREFQIPPRGYTPLVPILGKIFEAQAKHPKGDKKLLVFIATDGEPTDASDNTNISELEHLMRHKRQIDTTYVSFLVCTDDPTSVNYLSRWDKTMRHVDVTDDFRTERKKIRRCQKDGKYPFAYGDYIVKALAGSIIPELDRLNEEKN